MVKQNSKLKERIIDKVGELVDCIEKIGKLDYFEISIKHMNGDIVSNTEFSDKERLK